MKTLATIGIGLGLVTVLGCGGTDSPGRVCAAPSPSAASPRASGDSKEAMVNSDAEWKQKLSDEQYYICRQGGTERAFTGKLWDHHGDGVYKCVACGQVLFDSTAKFESGTGWPSFFAPAAEAAVGSVTDTSHGMRRVEVRCTKCESHLGHVFDDGPRPSGLRYCINSAALEFEERKADEK